MDEFVQTLRKAQRADADALESLIVRFTPLVRAECFAFVVRGGADVSHSDLAQEVLLRVWTRLNQFQGADDDGVCLAMFQRWIRTTTRHLVSNLLAKRQAEKRLRPGARPPADGKLPTEPWDDGSHVSPSRIAARAEEVDRLRAAMACLDDEQRRIIELSFFEGLSLRDTAARMQLTYEQARGRFARAITQLKAALF